MALFDKYKLEVYKNKVLRHMPSTNEKERGVINYVVCQIYFPKFPAMFWIVAPMSKLQIKWAFFKSP
jgi:hypothetical protein